MLGFLRSPPRRSDGIQVGDGDAAGIPSRYEREQLLAEQRANKLFAGRVGRWWWITAGKDELGRTVRFCWSRHRNEFGFFLSWREVYQRYTIADFKKLKIRINEAQDVILEHYNRRTQTNYKDVNRRYDFVARRSRKRCKEIAHARAEAWREKREPPAET